MKQGESLVILGKLNEGLSIFDHDAIIEGLSQSIEIVDPNNLKMLSLSLRDEWDILEEIRQNDDSEFMEGGFDPGPSLEDVILEGDQSTDTYIHFCKRLGLASLRNSPFRFLSNGEIRKGLLLKRVLQNPDLLILSNPFEGLDQHWRNEIMALLSEIHSSCHILLLTQRLRDWPDWIEQGYRLSHEQPPLLTTKRVCKEHEMASQQVTSIPPHLLDMSQPDLDDKTPLVEISDLNISYGSRKVFQHFSWTVQNGENWLITGSNGMGKTSLMDIIYADHDQSYGQDFSLFGMKRGQGESIWDLRRYMARVNIDSQRNLPKNQTVIAMIASGMEDTLGLRRPLQPHETVRAQEWLELLGIRHLEKYYCHQLHYGDLRTVLMARALIKLPRLLILDEPGQGLSDDQSDKVVSVVRHILERCPCSVLYVTHHPYDALLPFSHHLELKQNQDGFSHGVVHRL
jgi:molybdate transport system ATP-binding protein